MHGTISEKYMPPKQQLIVITAVFECRITYWEAKEGGYSYNYQLNSHCLCLPEMRGSPFYLIWMVTCHLCLLLSPLVIEFWCVGGLGHSAQGSRYTGMLHVHTLHSPLRMEGKQRKIYSGPPFSDLVNWDQFKYVWVLWRLKQIGFWELIVYFVNITSVCKCMLR